MIVRIINSWTAEYLSAMKSQDKTVKTKIESLGSLGAYALSLKQS